MTKSEDSKDLRRSSHFHLLGLLYLLVMSTIAFGAITITNVEIPHKPIIQVVSFLLAYAAAYALFLIFLLSYLSLLGGYIEKKIIRWHKDHPKIVYPVSTICFLGIAYPVLSKLLGGNTAVNNLYAYVLFTGAVTIFGQKLWNKRSNHNP